MKDQENITEDIWIPSYGKYIFDLLRYDDGSDSLTIRSRIEFFQRFTLYFSIAIIGIILVYAPTLLLSEFPYEDLDLMSILILGICLIWAGLIKALDQCTKGVIRITSKGITVITSVKNEDGSDGPSGNAEETNAQAEETDNWTGETKIERGSVQEKEGVQESEDEREDNGIPSESADNSDKDVQKPPGAPPPMFQSVIEFHDHAFAELDELRIIEGEKQYGGEGMILPVTLEATLQEKEQKRIHVWIHPKYGKMLRDAVFPAGSEHDVAENEE